MDAIVSGPGSVEYLLAIDELASMVPAYTDSYRVFQNAIKEARIKCGTDLEAEEAVAEKDKPTALELMQDIKDTPVKDIGITSSQLSERLHFMQHSMANEALAINRALSKWRERRWRTSKREAC